MDSIRLVSICLRAFHFYTQYSYLGKTTVLSCAMSDKSTSIEPTIGTDFGKIVINNTSIAIFEEGGRSGHRPLHRRYYRDVEGIIFVVDSNDREGIDEVRDKLHHIFNYEHRQQKPLLILANKQDLPNAMNVDELRDKLNLNTLNLNTKWHLQLISAINNEGVQEGLQWLENSLVEKADSMKPIVETVNDAKRMQKYLASILNMANFKTIFYKCV